MNDAFMHAAQRWLDTLPDAACKTSLAAAALLSLPGDEPPWRGTGMQAWMWSAGLTPGSHFPCPIRAWTARETHWVVRSGTDALGRWCDEERNVFTDVATAMGTPPARIVAIWLIGVSTFQHGAARAKFADIVLRNEQGTIQVL